MLKEDDLKEWCKAGKPIAGKSDGGGLTFTQWQRYRLMGFLGIAMPGGSGS